MGENWSEYSGAMFGWAEFRSELDSAPVKLLLLYQKL